MSTQFLEVGTLFWGELQYENMYTGASYVLWNKEISSSDLCIIFHSAEELLPWDKCCQFFFHVFEGPASAMIDFLMVTLQRPHNMQVR